VRIPGSRRLAEDHGTRTQKIAAATPERGANDLAHGFELSFADHLHHHLSRAGAGINVKLPRGTADAIENLKSQTVAVDAQGGVFLNNRRISLEALENELTALIGQDPQTAVLVRGDERIDYGQIVQVLRVLHKAGVTRMALVTEPE
jgi:biopolymer transport protein ExbD